MTKQQLVIDNLEEKLKVFTHAVNGKLTNDEDFILANTETPSDTFNILVPKNSNIKNMSKLKKGLDNFHKKNYPFSIWMDENYIKKDWSSLIQAYGLKEAERNVMMKLDNTLYVGQRISHQLTIEQVKNNEDLSKYIEVFISLFEGTPEQYALEKYFSKFSQKDLGINTQLFIGCIDGAAVTTGLLIKSEKSYGIYDVMTKENYRGKGLGSEMFQFLLNQTNNKEKPVVLQASDDGKNIYKRFGFTDVGEMIVFE
nr:GNAT family N-acetyltransferase [Mammaliicoccus lentus]